MKTTNDMKVSFAGHSINEGFARVSAAAFFAQLDPTAEEISDIKTAVSEAVTNCIVHAYRDDVGKIEMTAKILSNDEVYIKIRDGGCGIEDIKKAMEPTFTTDTAGERAGLGFAVMDTFMDKLRVYSKPGKGTTVVMKKKIKSRKSKND